MSQIETDPTPGSSYPSGIAVVFGGTGGIGRAICMALARRGADVALTYRSNETAARETVAAVQALGRKAEALQVELSQSQSIVRALQDQQSAHGCIHTVVFAAGADITMTYVADIDPAEWQHTLDADLGGFFHTLRAAIPLMRAQGGSIIAVTSAGLDRHPPKDILSVVPKAGIEALVRGVAREEGRHNIRANAVAPGVIDGGLFDRLRTQLDSGFVEAMRRNTALRRFGTVDEVAGLVAFLATREAAYITGQHICVDGGYSV